MQVYKLKGKFLYLWESLKEGAKRRGHLSAHYPPIKILFSKLQIFGCRIFKSLKKIYFSHTKKKTDSGVLSGDRESCWERARASKRLKTRRSMVKIKLAQLSKNQWGRGESVKNRRWHTIRACESRRKLAGTNSSTEELVKESEKTSKGQWETVRTTKWKPVRVVESQWTQ